MPTELIFCRRVWTPTKFHFFIRRTKHVCHTDTIRVTAKVSSGKCHISNLQMYCSWVILTRKLLGAITDIQGIVRHAGVLKYGERSNSTINRTLFIEIRILINLHIFRCRLTYQTLRKYVTFSVVVYLRFGHKRRQQFLDKDRAKYVIGLPTWMFYSWNTIQPYDLWLMA